MAKAPHLRRPDRKVLKINHNPNKLAVANNTVLSQDSSVVCALAEMIAAPIISEPTKMLKESRLAESSTVRRKPSNPRKETFHCKV